MGDERSTQRRARALQRAGERRARTREELVELDARYARVAAAAALEAVRRSARLGRRTA
ncbi:MAG: hypothetical protein JWN67_2511 [Actinomycetia bacterium]|nr:hypothetical protein [Actinomycetes bacterium]